MGYSIKVESYFSAAHRLKGHRGKCENLHGHNWKVEAVIEGDSLDRVGMLLDFKKAKDMLEEILAVLDHKQLDRIQFFKRGNPTSELIAEFVFTKYQKRLKSPLRLKGVSVWETPFSSATYSMD